MSTENTVGIPNSFGLSYLNSLGPVRPTLRTISQTECSSGIPEDNRWSFQDFVISLQPERDCRKSLWDEL